MGGCRPCRWVQQQGGKWAGVPCIACGLWKQSCWYHGGPGETFLALPPLSRGVLGTEVHRRALAPGLSWASGEAPPASLCWGVEPWGLEVHARELTPGRL